MECLKQQHSRDIKRKYIPIKRLLSVTFLPYICIQIISPSYELICETLPSHDNQTESDFKEVPLQNFKAFSSRKSCRDSRGKCRMLNRASLNP